MNPRFYFNSTRKAAASIYGGSCSSIHVILELWVVLFSGSILAVQMDRKMKHFRVDKMDNIDVVHQKREGKEAFKELKLSERSLRMFSMFSGKVQKVKIRFSSHLANVMIDRFGRDIVMVPDD